MPAFTAYLPSEVLSIPQLSQNAKNTGTWPRSCPGSPPDVCGVRARALPAPSILGEGSEGAVEAPSDKDGGEAPSEDYPIESMAARDSLVVFVCFSLSSRSSIASTGLIWD